MTEQTLEKPALADANEVASSAAGKPYAVPEVESFELDELTIEHGAALTANGRV